MANWDEIGLFGGFRCCEYAQSSLSSDIKKPALNKKGDTQAFTLPDYFAKTKGGQILKGANIISVPMSELDEATTMFRTQKNGDNGEMRKWVATKNLQSKNYMQSM